MIVYHANYGCDTGCCGHIIEVNGTQFGRFHFDYPCGGDRAAFRVWAEDLIRTECGEDHVKDLDWDNCEVLYD